MKSRIVVLFGLLAVTSPAQLTTDQRLADFRNLADLYARRYAPIQWKQSVVNFDVLNLAPWSARVSAVTNDLDFYDLMVEYVADLVDAHDQYMVPSDFEAHLGFTVDIYDGKVLIDSVDNTILPSAQFPIQVGDELISVDGKSAADLVQVFSRYVTGGNPRTVQRLAAGLITDRYQVEYPRAHELPDQTTFVVLRRGGASETYSAPWQKLGTPLTGLGASAGPRTTAQPLAARHGIHRLAGTAAYNPSLPGYRQMLQTLHNYTLPGRINVVGFDGLAPVFAMPASFVQRLGNHVFDPYFSGSYAAPDGTRIGFLRIPDFGFLDDASLDREIKFFQANTDVLVVDVMRNPGGDVCAAEATISRLTPRGFQGAAAEIRVDWTDIFSVNQGLADAKATGADDDTIAQLQLFQTEFQKAFYGQGTGRTPALPICASTTNRTPAPNPYSKPVLVLVDEMSASSADIFPAMVQDSQVGSLFGYRTMGAGGSPEGDYVGVYSEGATYVTRSLVVRPQPVGTPDYPTTGYIENVGVRPETVLNYMTADNLVNQGAAFVNAFTAAAQKLAKPGN